MIDVSFFASAIRVDKWLEMYEGIKSRNTVNFEFVFAGPYQPTYTLPDNFKFFKTNVKPVQCFEIAARNSSGVALLQCTDDVIYEDNAVDLMFEAYSKDPKHVMATCDYWEGDKDLSPYQNLMGEPNPPGWPMLPVCGMYDHEMYTILGGADRRFAGVMWELDMYMRMWEHGVRTVRVNKKMIEPWEPDSPDRLCHKYFPNDRPIILGIWKKDSMGNITRTSPVLSFRDENILTQNQN